MLTAGVTQLRTLILVSLYETKLLIALDGSVPILLSFSAGLATEGKKVREKKEAFFVRLTNSRSNKVRGGLSESQVRLR